MTKQSEIYDPAFFEFHKRWEPEYEHIAGWLCSWLDFDSAIDLGCGNGYIVAGLKRRGKAAVGFEVALDSARPFVPESIRDEFVLDRDFLRERPVQADLVVCTEVAEHLTPAEGRRLINVIARSTKKWCFFTAATPGQGGHHHMNEQPHEYWIRKMQRHGMRLDDIKTHFAKRMLSEKVTAMSWIPRNVMIFQQTIDHVARRKLFDKLLLTSGRAAVSSDVQSRTEDETDDPASPI